MLFNARTTGFALGAFALASAFIPSQPVPAPQVVATPPTVPFTVGEELVYRATFGGVRAGWGRMRVDCIEPVRGRDAYHLILTIDGGFLAYRIHDRYESWIDTATLASLRHTQQISEGTYNRTTTYEIYPERLQYQKNKEPILATVANPLDDGSFVYGVRIAGIAAGQVRTYDRYFKPEGNPVVLTGLITDTISVGAGTFVTTVVRPHIKSPGLFGENTDARIWFSADSNRYPVQVRTKIAKFPLTLKLESIIHGPTK